MTNNNAEPGPPPGGGPNIDNQDDSLKENLTVEELAKLTRLGGLQFEQHAKALQVLARGWLTVDDAGQLKSRRDGENARDALQRFITEYPHFVRRGSATIPQELTHTGPRRPDGEWELYFGPKADGRRAQELYQTNPVEYRRLKLTAEYERSRRS